MNDTADSRPLFQVNSYREYSKCEKKLTEVSCKEATVAVAVLNDRNLDNFFEIEGQLTVL